MLETGKYRLTGEISGIFLPSVRARTWHCVVHCGALFHYDNNIWRFLVHFFPV